MIINSVKKNRLILPVMIMLMSVSCGTHQPKPLLSGKINVSEPTEMTFRYDINGDLYTENVTTDSAGVFSFNPELPAEATDVALYIGNKSFGAFIQKGKSVIMDIDGDNVTFSGDNIDRNDVVNAYEQAYCYWKYKPTPDKPFVYEEWNALLESGYNNVCSKLSSLENDEIRDKYSRLNDARKKYFDIENLQMYRWDVKEDEALEISSRLDSLIASINPDLDESRLSGLINIWFNNANLVGARTNGSHYDFVIGMFAAVDSALNNDANKKNFYSSFGDMFFRDDLTDSIAEAFMENVRPFIANAPQVQKEFDEYMVERSKNVNDGDALPSNPVLVAPDGSKTTLADELQGKVVYIDFWATWCGPCCAEIPYMEKVYEKFKDNDNIRLISISIDDDRDAWLAKLDADKPGWPQFVMDKKTGDEFSKSMKINSIPRFLIIGRDGNFISTKAPRPSSGKVEQILNQAIEK